jgi:hypothetical protein
MKMKAPFSAAQFVDILKQYNESVFPMQIIFYLLAVVAIYLVIKPNAKSDRIISAVLAFLWLWMGIVYHYLFFAPVNPAAYSFGSAFIVQAALFLVFGVFQSNLSFRFAGDKFGITGIILILFALFIYPVLGFLFGNIYPGSPTFGLPCPTTIFTFGLLLLNRKKFPVGLLLIPFIWSIIGSTASINFGIIEDGGLLLAGLITLPLLIWHNSIRAKHHLQIAM